MKTTIVDSALDSVGDFLVIWIYLTMGAAVGIAVISPQPLTQAEIDLILPSIMAATLVATLAIDALGTVGALTMECFHMVAIRELLVMLFESLRYGDLAGHLRAWRDVAAGRVAADELSALFSGNSVESALPDALKGE